MSNTQQKIFVGLSGGVDSAVSCALLKEAGHNVVGVFIKVWQADFLPCTWREERREAMRVSAHLGIPFITLDLEKEYKAEVVDYMIREYGAGRVPNPDVMCNKYVKFGAFLDFALREGADGIATGHYARIQSREESHQSLVTSHQEEASHQSSVTSHQEEASHQSLVTSHQALGNSKESHQSLVTSHQALAGSEGNTHNQFRLLAGVDKEKDQSYFLWTMTQEQLARTCFPVGHLEKSEVRELAKKFGLPNAKKKDSQGLCFMGKVDMADFLKKFLDTKPGNVVNEAGEIIGTHDGAIVYTIGQRHGFLTKKILAQETPYVVICKDIVQNTITVAHKHTVSETTRTHEVSVFDLNCIGDLQDKGVTARIRYRGSLFPVTFLDLQLETRCAQVHFGEPQDGVAEGQSIVFYRSDECLGGGVIGN